MEVYFSLNNMDFLYLRLQKITWMKLYPLQFEPILKREYGVAKN
jgi:hypothetical protein